MSDAGVKEKGMVEIEAVKGQVKRLEEFSALRKWVYGEMEGLGWRQDRIEEQIEFSSRIGVEEKEGLLNFVDLYSQKRKEVNKVWKKYMPKKVWSGEVESFSKQAGNKLFKDVVGNKSKGEVEVLRTDVSIFFNCSDERDLDKLQELQEGEGEKWPEGAGGSTLPRITIKNFSEKGSVISAGFKREHAGHERYHYVQSMEQEAGVFSRIKKPAREIFFGFEELPVIDFAMDAEMLSSPGFIVDTKRRVAMEAIRKYLVGDLDFSDAKEIFAYVGVNNLRDIRQLTEIMFDGYDREKINEKVRDFLTVFQNYESELKFKGEVVDYADVWLKAGVAGEKFKKFKKKRIKGAIMAFFDLVDYYQGDVRMAEGVLAPFETRRWSVVARMVKKYGGQAKFS